MDQKPPEERRGVVGELEQVHSEVPPSQPEVVRCHEYPEPAEPRSTQPLLDIELDLVYTDQEPSSERRLLETELELVQTSSPDGGGEQTSLGDSQGRDTLRTSSDRSSSPRAKWESRRHGHGFLSSDSGFGAEDSTDNPGQHSVMLDPKVTLKGGSTISESRSREFPRPPRYLPLAILVSFGNPPLGLLAVIFSVLMERDVRNGDLQEAKRKSKVTMITIIMAFALTILTVVIALVVCTAQDRIPIPYHRYVVHQNTSQGDDTAATSTPINLDPPSKKGRKKMPALLQGLVNAGETFGKKKDKGKDDKSQDPPPLAPEILLPINGTEFENWKARNGTLEELHRRLFH